MSHPGESARSHASVTHRTQLCWVCREPPDACYSWAADVRPESIQVDLNSNGPGLSSHRAPPAQLSPGFVRLTLVSAVFLSCICLQDVLELDVVVLSWRFKRVTIVSPASFSAGVRSLCQLKRRDSSASVPLMAKEHLRLPPILSDFPRELCCLRDCLDDRFPRSVAHDHRHIQVSMSRMILSFGSWSAISSRQRAAADQGLV